MIRKVQIKDAAQIAEIYNYYVLNTIVTFDQIPFTVKEFEEKIEAIASSFPYLVFEENGEILGFAYANVWRTKPAYKHTVESTVYIKHTAFGKHIGTKLYTELLQLLKEQDMHVVIGGLSLPNEPSVILHEKFGFKKVGHFKEVGLKFEKWIDVGFWQLTL